MLTFSSFAPAKVNLTLHITGRSNNGYHTLDSLVVFVSVGDFISGQGLQDRDHISLITTGPIAKDLPEDNENLVLKAAHTLKTICLQNALNNKGVILRLHKSLPVMSGLGGGSANAAAVLRVLMQLWQLPPLPLLANDPLVALGSDVPVCLSCLPQRLSGIGEKVSPIQGLPPFALTLVKPQAGFTSKRAFACVKNPNLDPMPKKLPNFNDACSFGAWLSAQRNDLETIVTEQLPDVGHVLRKLAQTQHCLLSRMSGSGTTCFGLYESYAQAETAALQIKQHYPDWWIAVACPFIQCDNNVPITKSLPALQGSIV